MMSVLLLRHFDSFVVVHLEDVPIYSKGPSSHNCHVRAFLDILRRHKLYAKESKCDFYKDRVGLH